MSKRIVSEISTENIISMPRKKAKIGFLKNQENQETQTEYELNSESDSDYSSEFEEKSLSRSSKESEESSEFEDNSLESELHKLQLSDPEVYKSFIETQAEIIKTEPNIRNILKEPMLLSTRAKLVQLYEVYTCYDKTSEEYLELRNRLNKLFDKAKDEYKNYCKFTSEEHNIMDKKIEEIKDFSTDIELKYKILQLNTSDENKKIIYRRYNEMIEYESGNGDAEEKTKMKRWLDWAISLPYNNVKINTLSKTNLTEFLKYVKQRFDEELYGMQEIKEQLLIFINAKILNPNMKKCSLGLIGDPGTGKTSIARLLATVLDFPFEQISFGGVSNSDFLKGHSYTYIGSEPGIITKCLRNMKYKNGIIFFDEYEKISDNKDICASLLHITDPTQNSEFSDQYLSGIKIDLSNLWYIYSMNSLPEDSALRDRIFTIKIKGYSHEDKLNIVRDYILPKTLSNIKISKSDFIMKDATIDYFIRRTEVSRDKGIRNLENNIGEFCNKINFLVLHQNDSGTLEEFSKSNKSGISFDIKEKIQYPITITIDLIIKLTKHVEINDTILSMYS